MKRLAFCLVFITSTVALAQQPAKWRPNIADDNRAATWEQTIQFIANLDKAGGEKNNRVNEDSSPARCILEEDQTWPTQLAEQDRGSATRWKLGISWKFIAGLYAPGKFVVVDEDKGSFAESLGIHVGDRLYAINGVKWKDYLKRNPVIAAAKAGDMVTIDFEAPNGRHVEQGLLTAEFTSSDLHPMWMSEPPEREGFIDRDVRVKFTRKWIDFNKIDPMSVFVDEHNITHVEGTDHIPVEKIAFFRSTTSTYTDSPPGKFSEICSREKCEEWHDAGLESDLATSELGPMADMETAHRLARALMHASLLCGGTKAVSPF